MERLDNIPTDTVKRFQTHYRDPHIDADAIFYYVYGILHSPEYRSRFAADLKKMLPRVPLIGGAAEFRRFADAGRQLADLHVGYEDIEPWPVAVHGKSGTKLNPLPDSSEERQLYHVTQMDFGGKARQPNKTVIDYNSHIIVEGIPLEAYDYVVNGKSAIEWVMDRYQITTHKDSGIHNDPNAWSDNPRYILNLLLKVITVSMKTVGIVDDLPELSI